MIKIICVGKLKEKFWKNSSLEYLKRISKYTKIEVIQIPDFKSDIPSIELEKEKDKILSKIEDKDYIITLEIDGKELNSVEFSEKFEKIRNLKDKVTFIIGGSSGLHEEVKKKANFALSFSKFTFPHQLFRVILLEQIYRSFKIMNKETYHK